MASFKMLFLSKIEVKVCLLSFHYCWSKAPPGGSFLRSLRCHEKCFYVHIFEQWYQLTTFLSQASFYGKLGVATKLGCGSWASNQPQICGYEFVASLKSYCDPPKVSKVSHAYFSRRRSHGEKCQTLRNLSKIYTYI